MSHSYALVTGASRGIGAALATALAARGHSLILAARHERDLRALQTKLARPGIEVEVLPADLNAAEGAQRLLAAIAERGWSVDLLVNNAGLGSGGDFIAQPPARELEQVRVNVLAAVELAHGCAGAMAARGSGAVINVASTAAFQAVPGMATYAGTKAFLLHFSLALHEEMRGRGVHVMALCPGPTESNFFAAAGIRARPLTGGGRMQTATQVAELALRGLDAKRAVVVCGTANRVLVGASRLLPRLWTARIAGKVVRGWHRQQT